MSRNKRHERMTRREKVGEVVPVVHGEVIVPKQQQPIRLDPANPRQKQLLAFLRDGRQVVFAQGSAGSGKSMVATFHAAEQLRLKKIDKIYLVRANVSTGKSLGMLPGDLDSKLVVFFKQTLTHLAKFMGQSFLTYCLEKKVVEMLSIEHMRGTSLEDCLVICEESQNLLADEMEMLLSRIGKNCQLVMTGDQKQNDLKGNSGLIRTISLIEKTLADMPDHLNDEDLYCMEQNIGIVTFTPDDVVRSGLCRAFVKMYHYS